jgi:hypothetical protein
MNNQWGAMLFQQQPIPAGESSGFDAGVVWRTLIDLGEGFLRRLSYIVMGVVVFISFLIIVAFRGRMNPNYAVLILLAVLVLSIIRMAVNSFKAQKRM